MVYGPVITFGNGLHTKWARYRARSLSIMFQKVETICSFHPRRWQRVRVWCVTPCNGFRKRSNKYCISRSNHKPISDPKRIENNNKKTKPLIFKNSHTAVNSYTIVLDGQHTLWTQFHSKHHRRLSEPTHSHHSPFRPYKSFNQKK